MSEYAYLNGVAQLPNTYVRHMESHKGDLPPEDEQVADEIIYQVICPQILQSRAENNKLHWEEHGVGKLYRLIQRLNFRRLPKIHDQ